MKRNGTLNIVVSQFSNQMMSPIVQVLSQVAAEKGLPHCGSGTGGSQMRMGTSYFCLGEKGKDSSIPQRVGRGQGDIILGLEAGYALTVAADLMDSHGTAIINTWQFHPPYIAPPHTKYPTVEESLDFLGQLVEKVIPIDGPSLAREAGDKRMFQGLLEPVMFGALMGTGLLPFSADETEEVLAQLSRPWEKDQLVRAFRLGVTAAAEAA